jgi:hypothetical protein
MVFEMESGFSIRLIESGMWGNTIKEAATNVLKDKALHSKSLLELASLVQTALKANLENSISLLAERLEQLAAQTRDIIQLLQSLPAPYSDCEIWRYPPNKCRSGN